MITASSSAAQPQPGTTTTAPPPPAARPTMWVVLVGLAILVVGGILWYEGAFNSRPRVALVTASAGPYWDLIVKGATDAAERYGVRLEVVRPPSDEPSQSKAIQSLVGQGYDGVAVSPNDAGRQA